MSRAGKVGVASNNNHENYSRTHRRRHQQQIERIKREIQIRAVISDDLDLDIEEDDEDEDEDDEEKEVNADVLENDFSEPSIVEEGRQSPRGRRQVCKIRQKLYPFIAFWLDCEKYNILRGM